MIVKNKKPNISKYDFLKLFLITSTIQEESNIIDNHDLEKKLYEFYDIPEFNFLFEDLEKKEDKANPKNNHIDLNSAFQIAYAYGILNITSDSSLQKSICTLSKSDAAKLISSYPFNITDAMNCLCKKYYEKNVKLMILKKTTSK